MVASLKVRELDAAGHAAVTTLVLDPVVGHDAAGLVGHTPAIHAALGVPHVHGLVVPTHMGRGGVIMCQYNACYTSQDSITQGSMLSTVYIARGLAKDVLGLVHFCEDDANWSTKYMVLFRI